MKALRRMIMSAAPTCTLWVPMMYRDALCFRFNRRWTITAKEFREASLPMRK